jgi:CRISPR/Cas system CSM-associated protein Csm3 (group 7 of RAMP superfamily)
VPSQGLGKVTSQGLGQVASQGLGQVTSQGLGQVTFTSDTVRESPVPRRMRWWNFEKFQIFRKIEKRSKRSEMRTKPKIF